MWYSKHCDTSLPRFEGWSRPCRPLNVVTCQGLQGLPPPVFSFLGTASRSFQGFSFSHRSSSPQATMNSSRAELLAVCVVTYSNSEQQQLQTVKKYEYQTLFLHRSIEYLCGQSYFSSGINRSTDDESRQGSSPQDSTSNICSLVFRD